MSAVCLCNAWIKSAAKQCGKPCIFEFFTICPLPRIVKVSGKALFFTAFFINGTPLRIIGILRLIICCIHIIYATGQTCVHDGQILIRKCNVHDQIRLITIDQFDELIHIICINLGCGKNRLCLSL